MDIQLMDQHLVVVMISIFAINKIQIWEVTVILVVHIIYQMDTHLLEMQKIFWQEIITNGQQLKLKSIK
jgi:hypothetical protein